MEKKRVLKFKLTKKHVEKSEAEQLEYENKPKPYCAICPVAICLEEKLDLPFRLIDNREIYDIGVDGVHIRLKGFILETPIAVTRFIQSYDTYKGGFYRNNFLELLPINFSLEIPESIKTRKKKSNEDSLSKM